MISYPDFFEAKYNIQDEPYEGSEGQLWNQISQDIFGRDDLEWILIQFNSDLSEDSKTGFGLAENFDLRVPIVDLSSLPSSNVPDWRIAAES